MMHAVPAGLDEGEAVVAPVDMEEERLEWLQAVVGQPEAEDVAIERDHLVEPLDRRDRMAHAERAGAEAGDRAARPERLGRGLGEMEDFKPAAGRVGENDQVDDAPLLGKTAGA